MFKEKTSRKRLATNQNAKDAATLDARHQQMLNSFVTQNDRLAQLYIDDAALAAKSATLMSHIQHLRTTGAIHTAEYHHTWRESLECTEKHDELRKEITRLEHCTDEIEYLENTASILFQYYELVEKQADGSQAQIHSVVPPPSTKVKGRRKALPVASKTILEALHLVPPTTPATAAEDQTPISNKSVLVDAYLAATDPTYLPEFIMPDVEFTEQCPECANALICVQQEGIMVCTGCGCQQQLIVEQNRPLLRVPSSKEASHLSYKRINHFKEWCAQVQGKESTDIPEEVFEVVLAEIKKEKIVNSKGITYQKMREILKKLGINKYYEHIYYIIYRINGVPPPHFTPEIEEKLCNMFKDIQGPFLKFCPLGRKNFLSYSYVLYKFMEILGFKECLKLFPLLKARSKLFVQDMVWKNITAELKWPYYSTV